MHAPALLVKYSNNACVFDAKVAHENILSQSVLETRARVHTQKTANPVRIVSRPPSPARCGTLIWQKSVCQMQMSLLMKMMAPQGRCFLYCPETDSLASSYRLVFIKHGIQAFQILAVPQLSNHHLNSLSISSFENFSFCCYCKKLKIKLMVMETRKQYRPLSAKTNKNKLIYYQR